MTGLGAGRGAAQPGARERPAGSTAVRAPEPGLGGLRSVRRRAVLLEEGGAGAAMFVARSIAADHKDLIHDVSFDFHGRRMATCSSDQSVKVRAGPSPEGGGSVRGPLSERRGAWRVDSSRLEARCGHEVRSPGRLADTLLLAIVESTPPGPPPPPPRGCGGVRASRRRARSCREGGRARGSGRLCRAARLGPRRHGTAPRWSGWGPGRGGAGTVGGVSRPPSTSAPPSRGTPPCRPPAPHRRAAGAPRGRSAPYATSSQAGRNPLPGLQVLRGPGFLARRAVGVLQ